MKHNKNIIDLFHKTASIVRQKGAKLSQSQEDAIAARIAEETAKPLSVAVLGQTGVGKSSLINALFGTNLRTHDSRPCTSTPECHIAASDSGHELRFWDMPGIGESSQADARYLELYKTKMLESDVVIWACHADSRSVTFELDALNRLLSGLDISLQKKLASKITFVLTKADLVFCEPWIVNRDGSSSLVAASEKTELLLEEKANYFREALILPLTDRIETRTFHDGTWNLEIERMRHDDHHVFYQGVMDFNTRETLKAKHPQHSLVFDRLFENTAVVCCSSRFKYNLAKLMTLVVSRLGRGASFRFRAFTSPEQMDVVKWDDVKMYSNLVVFDSITGKIVFNIQ